MNNVHKVLRSGLGKEWVLNRFVATVIKIVIQWKDKHKIYQADNKNARRKYRINKDKVNLHWVCILNSKDAWEFGPLGQVWDEMY